MSEVRLPLKSPVPTIAHGEAAPPMTVLDETVPPLAIVHTSTCPVFASRHKMSVVPSSLKSPVPTMVHTLESNPKLTVDVLVAPLMNQITVSPLGLCHSRSDTPSPL